MRRLALCALLLGACSADVSDMPADEARSLRPYPNPFGPSDALYAPQPRREKPLEVVVTPDGNKAYVSLQGIPDEPGHHVVRVDVSDRGGRVKRIEVGSSPTGLAMHPGGRLVVALNRFSNFASVIDTRDDVVLHRLPVDFYSIEAVFSPDGKRLFITNRHADAVQVLDVEATVDGLRVLRRHDDITVGTNPRDIAISGDGSLVAAGALSGGTVSLIDADTLQRIADINVGAPVNGLAFAGDYLVVATLSAATHHLPFAGPDTDGDGKPGDGTPNVNFPDLQNEIAVYDRSGEERWRYTSDTICCKDFRDVDPKDSARHGDLLPPRSRWIVGGALPEQLTVDSRAAKPMVYVTYSASNQMQGFELDPATGALSAKTVWPTRGHNPHGIATTDRFLLVVHRLSETLGLYDRRSGKWLAHAVVGDVSSGHFPATDAEIGELINHVSAPLSIDGDQSCTHCHREGGAVDKAFSMPLSQFGGVGSRMAMAYRGAADTRPWFFEGNMTETNFKAVMNELARLEHFCCTDKTLWPNGAPADCATNPPAKCSDALPGSPDGLGAQRGRAIAHPRPTAALTRDQFYLDVVKRLVGRTEAFGDALTSTDPDSGKQRPAKLDFAGVSRALGLFLLVKTRLLPNPNDPGTAAAQRGKALFHSLDTGCATCHPAPTFAVSTDVNPLQVPLLMGPVISPLRAADGSNLDLLSAGFAKAFPSAKNDTCEQKCGKAQCDADPRTCDALRNVYLGVPSLRGVWDRVPGGLLHDGRARSLREVICTPGHPALGAGEHGFNEKDGIVDSHGGTSHLSVQDIHDLITYLKTL